MTVRPDGSLLLKTGFSQAFLGVCDAHVFWFHVAGLIPVLESSQKFAETIGLGSLPSWGFCKVSFMRDTLRQMTTRTPWFSRP